MKNSVYISLMLFSFYFAGRAQEVEGFHVGGRFGLGESAIQSNLQNTSDKLVVSGGVAANYQFNKWVGMNADFLLTSSGIKANGATRTQDVLGGSHHYSYKERYDLVNAEVPVAGQLSLWFGDLFVRAYTGPGINFNLLSARTRTYDDAGFNDGQGYSNRDLESTNNVTYSMLYGAGIGARSRNDQLFFLDLRLSRAITPFGTIEGSNAYNHYYCLSGGYIF